MRRNQQRPLSKQLSDPRQTGPGTKSVQFTSDLSLTSTFRSRYGAAALEQHPDRLNPNQILRCKPRSEGQLTAAVNRNVVIDF